LAAAETPGPDSNCANRALIVLAALDLDVLLDQAPAPSIQEDLNGGLRKVSFGY
jgi:hypothetical protein